jgi:Uma2 family endonuclease
MASSVLIPVSEYLNTTYRPDCDYIDGQVKERNVGEQPHALVQGILYGILRDHRRVWGVRPLLEQRVQVASKRYRVPDLCVIRNTETKDPILTYAPLLCVEVLSKDDTLDEIQQRVNDYAALGVGTIWVLDPLARIGYHATVKGFDAPSDDILRVEGTLMRVSLVDLFAEYDES